MNRWKRLVKCNTQKLRLANEVIVHEIKFPTEVLISFVILVTNPCFARKSRLCTDISYSECSYASGSWLQSNSPFPRIRSWSLTAVELTFRFWTAFRRPGVIGITIILWQVNTWVLKLLVVFCKFQWFQYLYLDSWSQTNLWSVTPVPKVLRFLIKN